MKLQDIDCSYIKRGIRFIMSGYFSPELIDQIRDANDIVDLISEYVPLKKRGKNYVGLCPFHAEKAPSFNVSPDKQMFYCFGCGEGKYLFAQKIV